MTSIVFENVPHGSAAVDPGVVYPSYVSFDEFIDVERLRSLDGYISRRLERRIQTTKDSLFLNQHRLDENTPYQPGVREIWLSRTAPGTPYDYLDLDRTELWEPTQDASDFALLMEFIATMPFESTGRILIIYDDGARPVPAHRDHERTDVCHDFIWFRTNLRKPFYLLDQRSGQKLYVDTFSAWFDTVNQYHGSDACDGLAFSVRVDGHFTSEFRSRIPEPSKNAASTPSLWASTSQQSGGATI